MKPGLKTRKQRNNKAAWQPVNGCQVFYLSSYRKTNLFKKYRKSILTTSWMGAILSIANLSLVCFAILINQEDPKDESVWLSACLYAPAIVEPPG